MPPIQTISCATDELHHRYGARILSLCERMCGRRDWAEDAAQEAWIAYHSQCRRGDPPTEPLGWLVRTATRCCVDLIRSESRRRRRERHAASERTPSTDEESRVDLEALRQALARLPARHREPVVLRYLAEADIPTVARELGCSPGAARVRIHRGLAQLKRLTPGGAIGALLLGLRPSAQAATPPSALTPQLAASGAVGAGSGLGGFLMTLSLTTLTTAAALAFTLPLLGSASEAPDGEAAATTTAADDGLAVISMEEESVDELYARAQAAVRAEEFDTAVRLLEQVLQRQDDHQAARTLLQQARQLRHAQTREQITRATAHTLNQQLAAAEDRIRDLEAENRRLRAAIRALTGGEEEAQRQAEADAERPAARDAEARHGGLEPAPNRIHATVEAVRGNEAGQQDLVMLSVQDPGGVREGMELIVHRDQTYLVTVSVERIVGEMVACRILPDSWNPHGETVRQGDVAVDSMF